MLETEELMGYFPPDNPEGRWFTSEDHTSYVRYYETGFREVIHKGTVQGDYGPESGWIVSVGYMKHQFSQGPKAFSTVKEAKQWANYRDLEAIHNLRKEIDELKQRYEVAQNVLQQTA